MANASFGIEHPLVTVNDIAATAARYEALGFDPTPLGRHPWGTINRLVMFPDNFIELIAIGDAAAIEADPVGGHLFGRRVRDRLALGEGISLMALRSADARADEAAAVARGAPSAGRVEFRRAVRLPDGTRDEAVVTLAILPDESHPGLGVFLCQQHKPHLVWNPDWLRHRNGASAITSVTYLAKNPVMLMPRLAAVWGLENVTGHAGWMSAQTAGGEVRLVDAAGYAERFGGIDLPDGAASRAPCGVGISVRLADLAIPAAVPGVVARGARLYVPPALAGGVALELHT
jgi:hypothetical protein